VDNIVPHTSAQSGVSVCLCVTLSLK